jgi:hypothetical protein
MHMGWLMRAEKILGTKIETVEPWQCMSCQGWTRSALARPKGYVVVHVRVQLGFLPSGGFFSMKFSFEREHIARCTLQCKPCAVYSVSFLAFFLLLFPSPSFSWLPFESSRLRVKGRPKSAERKRATKKEAVSSKGLIRPAATS